MLGNRAGEKQKVIPVWVFSLLWRLELSVLVSAHLPHGLICRRTGSSSSSHARLRASSPLCLPSLPGQVVPDLVAMMTTACPWDSDNQNEVLGAHMCPCDVNPSSSIFYQYGS